MAKSIKKQDPEYCYSEKCDIIDELFDKYCVEYPRCYRMSDMFKYDFSEDTFTMKCEAYTVKIQQDGWMNVSTEPNCGIGELDIEILSRIVEIKDELIECLEIINNIEVKGELMSVIKEMKSGNWNGDTTPDGNPCYVDTTFGYGLIIVNDKDKDLLYVQGANDYSDDFKLEYDDYYCDSAEEIYETVNDIVKSWVKYIHKNKDRLDNIIELNKNCR